MPLACFDANGKVSTHWKHAKGMSLRYDANLHPIGVKKDPMERIHRVFWLFWESVCLFLVVGYPVLSVYEGLDPWSHLVGLASLWIEAALPWEDGAFQVRHHSQVAAVLRGDTCDAAWRAVRVGRI